MNTNNNIPLPKLPRNLLSQNIEKLLHLKTGQLISQSKQALLVTLNSDFYFQEEKKYDKKLVEFNKQMLEHQNRLKNPIGRISGKDKKETKTWYSGKAIREKLETDEAKNRIFLTVRNNRGGIIASIDGKYKENQNDFTINYMFVHPDHRNHGIGLQLMDNILAQAKNKYPSLETITSYHSQDNSYSENIHDSFGFSVAGEKKINLYGVDTSPGIKRILEVSPTRSISV